MKDFEHLKSLWLSQPKDEQLSVEEVLKQVKKDMGGLGRKLFASIIIMATALSCMLLVMLFFVFHSAITYIGILIILSTIFIYGLLMIRDYRLIYNRDFTLNTNEYLQQLKAYQKKHTNFYGWVYYLYLLLISVGLLLYSLEILEATSFYMKVLTYVATLIWFALCTFYFRKKIISSEQEKVRLMIDRLERLQHQFE